MIFENPTFHEGLNITVRRGAKQYLNETEFGNYAYGKGDADEPIGFVFVEYQWQIRFVDIENEDIEKEHDPNCRNIDALYETMLKFYPDFDAREIVTLVAFRFKPFSDAFTFSNLS